MVGLSLKKDWTFEPYENVSEGGRENPREFHEKNPNSPRDYRLQEEPPAQGSMAEGTEVHQLKAAMADTQLMADPLNRSKVGRSLRSAEGLLLPGGEAGVMQGLEDYIHTL